MSETNNAKPSIAHIEGRDSTRKTQELGVNNKIKTVDVRDIALADAVIKDNQSLWSKSNLRLYAVTLLITLTNYMSGFDGSIMSSLNAMPAFHFYFSVEMQGSSIGLVFAMYTVGQIIASLFAAPASDYFGRRFAMFTGSLFIILGSIVQSTAPSLNAYMGGRFLLGFGAALCGNGAGVYMVEISPPTWRGIFGGLYHSVGYYVGAIAASWTCYGSNRIHGNWSWRTPTVIQCLPAVIVACCIWFLPESPRWLVSHGRNVEARRVLVRYHGNDKEDSAIVSLQMAEIETQTTYDIEVNKNKYWDYRPLFKTRDRIFRLYLLLLVSVFSQFIGGAVISYYTPVILQNVGITSPNQQLLLNALNIVFSFLSAFIGSFTVEKFGRRNLFLWGTLLTGLAYIPMNVIAAQANGHVATGTGYAFIACIFLYGIFFSFCLTPLQTLYPAEILPNDIRAQGMAFQGLLGGLASFINTYATPVALKNIGWKTYTIFLLLHFVELALLYWSIVETKGRSLEELEEIFQNRHPVKRSLEKTKIVAVEGKGIKMELNP